MPFTTWQIIGRAGSVDVPRGSLFRTTHELFWPVMRLIADGQLAEARRVIASIPRRA